MQQTVNKKRTNESDLMLGPSQISWIEKETNSAFPAHIFKP